MSLEFYNNEYSKIFNEIERNKDVCKDNICAICKESLLVDTIKLHCNHRYHSECLINSFIKWESKKCPLCNEHFILDSYKSCCSKKMKDNKICQRVCYNDEGLCKIHVKSYLKEIEKNSKNEKKKEINQLKKTIKSKQTKLKSLNKQVQSIKEELKALNISLEELT